MKTSELRGAALDWAVAKCEDAWVRDGVDDDCPEYSTKWAQGGPIIQRERINISDDGGDGWKADDSIGHWGYGPAPLIAAMRCYVAAKLGDNIDIPKELSEGAQRYAVETLMAHGWENCWADDGVVLTFASREEAQTEINDLLRRTRRLWPTYKDSDYRIVIVREAV